MLYRASNREEGLQNAKSRSPSQHNRLYYVDWLRVIAILSVFFYHCDRFFDYRMYPIQTSAKSLISTIHRDFFQIWMMPLFFLISGAAVYHSLNSRKSSMFVKERFTRLLLPFLTVGLFIVVPPQIYVERLLNGQFSGSYFQWYPHYFSGFYPKGNFAFQGMHLWYLLELFLYSLLLLPIFMPAGNSRVSILARVASIFERSWSVLLLFIPLAGVSIFTDRAGLAALKIMGGWDPLSYHLFFLYGYLIFSNERIVESINLHCGIYLITSGILTVLLLYIEFGIHSPEISGVARYNLAIKALLSGKGIGTPQPTSDAWYAILILRSLTAWCWILGLTGMGSRILNFRNKALAYCNEAILPFYILHQTILLVIGFYVIRWDLGIFWKYVIITSSSMLAIMTLYEFAIRRVNALRFFFGMRMIK